MTNNDAIFALSSGRGKSGVAVIRISGNNLTEFAEKIIGRAPTPRHAYFTNLTDDAGEIIDQCVILYFSAPNSFTGTDIIEIQSHGAPAVINKIFEFLRANDMRIATPGEFSRRAFYNGKMDLSDVDGLVALLDAQTDRQRAAALKSMMGGDSDIYAEWRNQMLKISAYAAAMTDYNSDDLPGDIDKTIYEHIKTLYTAVSGALNKYKTSRAITCGVNIAIVGETNVGKSSLFNRIVGSARAIVSDIPGTTRDVVSATMDIGGYMVNISDTAGIRDATDTIERIGIERTNNEIENADIVIHVINPNDEYRLVRDDEILVINKSDTTDTHNFDDAIYTSAKTGDGVAELMQEIMRRINQITGNGESVLMINARTYDLVKTAANELKNALELSNGDYDILSEHVRYAADAIGKILGVIGTNEVLDMTFSQLCLGK
ncbi:MAG: tRNA uridine-5-carboxymethylaminomethyl(34) synthesis GTPase MnmE [Alphaproteobacteria bacterium]|nr:tRNA uridine-5-carboxymethylaminomethyl(34) synthesis GTPase MnmE [Alphaproteobacteria bacterium]